MGDDGVKNVSEEIRDTESGSGGGDEERFVTDIAGILSSVAAVMGDWLVSSSLHTMHSTSFDFNDFRKHVRSYDDCREIVQCGTDRSIVEKSWKKVIQKWEEDFVGQVRAFKSNKKFLNDC